MEELSKEEIKRLAEVFAKYKDGFESGTLIKSVLLNIGEPNKNDDIFEMPVKQEIQVLYDPYINRDNNDSK